MFVATMMEILKKTDRITIVKLDVLNVHKRTEEMSMVRANFKTYKEKATYI